MGNKNFFKQCSVIGIHWQKSKPWTNQMIYQRPGQNLLTIDSRGIGDAKCVQEELKLIRNLVKKLFISKH